ncbi:MAG: tRNA (N(6)-L-threonylcarbamoyladenosine(37)-C(2))-methylthiotransferase MtaB [Thermodesulfovibrionales bacterium]|nr:tRNA (N(6)-L-threonylcarbamoyladenosine(37)-C(2))-methylthiotransferase MtaB [Thermodesulfovibrionales bacterium]
MKISILTIGCRTNQSESQEILNEALRNGYQLADLMDNPDICIINTCSVTSKADSQSRQTIAKGLKHAKKVIVTGCYVHLNKKELVNLDKVLIFDNNNKLLINNLLKHNIIDRQNVSKTTLNVSRPIIKVQEGCNDNCSYCSIIYARGRARSIDMETIIQKIKNYSKEGFPEVVLSGTNIGQYGNDFNGNINICTLISEILFKTEIKKIRISSIEVKYITNSFLELLKDDRVCKHLHIPLQSGDDNTLKKMKRPYSTVFFEDKINEIRSISKDISIGTDIIVGFPTETGFEFDNSFNFVKQIGFSYLHVFPFSKRKDTLAGKIDLCYKTQELNRRLTIMKELSSSLKSNYIMSQLNKKLDYIIEKRHGNHYIGTTDNYIKAIINKQKDYPEKTIIKIKLTKYKSGIPTGICV